MQKIKPLSHMFSLEQISAVVPHCRQSSLGWRELYHKSDPAVPGVQRGFKTEKLNARYSPAQGGGWIQMTDAQVLILTVSLTVENFACKASKWHEKE